MSKTEFYDTNKVKIIYYLIKIIKKKKNLQIICPAVYIWAQATEAKYLKNTCTSNVSVRPVIIPQNICDTIPNSITLRGFCLNSY